jgi:hypothetical protein
MQSQGKMTTFGSFSRFHIFGTFSAQSDKFLHQDLQRKENVSIRITQGTKGKKRKTTTHIIRRATGLMGFKGNVGFLRLLRTLGTSSHRNFFDRSSGSLWGLRGRLNFLRRGSISIYIFGRRSNGSIPFRVLIVTAKKAKGKRFYTTRKEESK